MRKVTLALGLVVWMLGGCGAKQLAPSVAAVVDKHNEVRSSVGSAPLQWSDALAQQAQDWANRCDFNHSASSGYGENLYVTSGDGEEAANKAVESWAAERASYNPATNSCASGEMCGHYTQVVWADTTTVGCAVAACPEIRDAFAGTIVVCQYYPAGNYRGVSPFKR